MKKRSMRAAGLVVVTFVTAAQAGPDPAAKCEGAKHDTAGKYFACLGKAEKGLAYTSDTAKYDLAVAKCEEKYGSSWLKAEDPGACAVTGNQASIHDFTLDCAESVAAAIAGGTLPPNPQDCADDLEICTSGSATAADVRSGETFSSSAGLGLTGTMVPGQPLETGASLCYVGNTFTQQPCAGTGQDGDVNAGATRGYVDNGDGTITDLATGLMWEKLSNDGSIHDVDTQYIWSDAFTVKIAQLNSGSFAGHNDWRVPSVNELLSLVDYGKEGPAIDDIFDTACPGACTVLTCSCTSLDEYWSSTTFLAAASDAWAVDGGNGQTFNQDKDSVTQPVRAVRGGL